MLFGKRRALAEARHIGTQVVHPHVVGAVFILIRLATVPLVKNSTLVLRPGVKDAGRQTQDGVQMAFVHQVATNIGALTAFKQHVIRHHHRRARPRGAGFQ